MPPNNSEATHSKGFSETSFYNYKLLTWITLHTDQRHIPRDWQWSSPLWSLSLILLVQFFLRTRRHGKLSQNIWLSQVHTQGALQLIISLHLNPTSPSVPIYSSVVRFNHQGVHYPVHHFCGGPSSNCYSQTHVLANVHTRLDQSLSSNLEQYQKLLKYII